MTRKKLRIQILLLSILSFISLSKARTNLECYSDYLDLITCVWNTSSAEARLHITPTTNCSLQGKHEIDDEVQIRQSNLESLGSSQLELRKGTLIFSEESLYYALKASLNVQCENMTEPVETIPEFVPSFNVKLHPPKRPIVEGNNVTWKPGTPQTSVIKQLLYEVQWGLLENSWEKNQVASIREEHCELPEEKLIMGRQYVIRVRSIPEDRQKFWSEWSPVTQWKSTVGSQPEDPDYMALGLFTNLISLILASVAVCLLVFFCLLRNRRIMKCSHVPTPGKYFGNLFSDHGGDFKSWLGPIVTHEMFIKTDSECVSHMTIYKSCNSEMLSSKMEKEVNIKDGNTSSFSNSTYFLSQSSKCGGIVDQLEPCAADCPYGPAGGGSVQEKLLPTPQDISHDNELSEVSMNTPLETSSSYKQLQKLRLDIQSPDSGFAGSSEEQESQEESGSEGLPSPPVVGNTLPISCILPCPVPHLMGFANLGIPPGLVWSPLNNQPFPTLPPDISRNIWLGNCNIVPCSGILEPSSDDYMPVKKVQG